LNKKLTVFSWEYDLKMAASVLQPALCRIYIYNLNYLFNVKKMCSFLNEEKCTDFANKNCTTVSFGGFILFTLFLVKNDCPKNKIV